MPRTIAECIECHRQAPLVSKDRCAACYMQARRASDIINKPRDDRKARQKLRRAWCALICAAENMGMVEDDIEVLNVILEPYVLALLPPDPPESEVRELTAVAE
jgi:hypothetical protein